LLFAKTLDDAIETLTGPKVAGVYNLNIIDIYNEKLICVEKASFGIFSIKEIYLNAIPYFHANIY